MTHHDHHTHPGHEHVHGPDCGHVQVQHEDHVDYLHDGHLHRPHEDHVDEHVLPVSDDLPADCTPDHDCAEFDAEHVHGPDCGHEPVPHGDHTDYLVGGHLHHPHGDHCDHHGELVHA